MTIHLIQKILSDLTYILVYFCYELINGYFANLKEQLQVKISFFLIREDQKSRVMDNKHDLRKGARSDLICQFS